MEMLMGVGSIFFRGANSGFLGVAKGFFQRGVKSGEISLYPLEAKRNVFANNLTGK